MRGRFFDTRKVFLYALLTAISLVSLASSAPPNANPKEALILRRITEYWRDGDYATVKAQAIDFLEKNPESPLQDHLNAMLGDLYFQERNFQQALATYSLIETPEIQGKTFFNHLQAQFEIRDYPAVMEKASDYIKQSKKTNAAQITRVRYLLAEASFRHALKCKELEQKLFYLKMAKPHYKMLTQTKYSEQALFPLAEIHRLLREDEQAATLYFTLAQKFPKYAERFLFQAAILQIQNNKSEAAKTFERVHAMGGKRSRLAAFNRLILLYQAEKYEQFLDTYEQVIGLMPEQKLPLLTFYEGRCHYLLGNYEQAVLPLESFIAKSSGRSKELRSAHLLLVNCSRYLKDIALVKRTFDSYKTSFPQDADLPKILMVHAQMCRESGDFALALADLDTITTDYPNYEEAEAVMYDHALLLSQTEQWEKARALFFAFAEKYPQSEKKVAAWRHLLNCSIEELRSPNLENTDQARESFITVLKQALAHENVLSAREKQQYSLTMMKCLCELQRYEEAIPMLSEYISNPFEEGFLAEAYLLLAICHQKIDRNLSLFIEYAESALRCDPNLPRNEILHLELYNTYLEQNFSDPGVDEEQSIEYAAEHLFASNAWQNQSLKLDNHLWLSNYFYEASKDGCIAAREKAILLFSHLLGVEKHLEDLNIHADSIHLEVEALKFAHLLELDHRHQDKILFLEQLVHNQEKQSSLPWKLKRRTCLELAKAYEDDGQKKRALDLYQSLVKTSKRISSKVASAAQLHAANLSYETLAPQQKTSKSPEMIGILHTLKDLQIQKKLPAEPLHLEAALRYAEIRSQLSSGEQQAKNTHFFYKRMFDDFHNTEDPITKEYNRLRESHSEQDGIFGAYMRYLDAQMLLCHAQAAQTDDNSELEYKALNILNELLQHEDYLKPYLLERVQSTRAKIAQGL